MGNNIYSHDEIKKFAETGWKFRLKKVKGKYYITRRKGQTEKSMGRYNEQLWKIIEAFKENKTPSMSGTTAERLNEVQILFEKWVRNLGTHRGFIAFNNCLFVDKEQYCTYYRFKEKPVFPPYIEKISGKDPLKLKVMPEKGMPLQFWVHKASTEFCKNCHAYVSKEIKEKILQS